MLLAVSTLLTALICAPLFGGYLIYRDAVAVPTFTLTPSAFGIDGSAPRAVPQDAVLGLVSQVVDGGWLVAALTTAAVFGAGVGYGRLARRLVPAAGTAGAVAAATVAIWNPFVAERLLQGHWSLLLGYAALGPIVLAVLDRRPVVLLSWLAVAGFTPTGSILAATVAVAAAVAVRPPRRFVGAAVLGWVATASPWLVGAVVSSASASSGGASAFALRAEPGLGSFGTALGLGGIWNADAVPTSRTSLWALVGTAALLAVVAAGAFELRRTEDRSIRALAVLAGAAVLFAVLAATGPGPAVMDAALAHVPGAGLLRDTQKYLALAVPFFAVAAAASVAALRRWVPAGFAAAGVALLVAAPLPDLAWGVGGAVTPVRIPSDYAVVTDAIGDSDRGVVLWPASTVRELTWTNGPSLSPLPRMVDAPLITGDGLRVDGRVYDAPTGRHAEVIAALEAGDSARLAALGIGWVISEEAGAPPGLPTATEVFHGEHLRLFRVPDAVPAPSPSAPSPSAPAWVAAITATALWFAALLAGLVAAARRTRNQRRARKTASKPSAASDHE